MKRTFNYKAAMKRLRGKVPFNYDLRKPLTPGQKSAIKRAHNTAVQFGLTKDKSKGNYVPVKKHRNETKKDYNKRLKAIKENMGQSHTQFKGVFTDAPIYLKDVHYSFKGDTLTVTRPKFGYVEEWVPLDLVRLAQEGYGAIADLIEDYRDKGFERFQFVSNGAYRAGESISLDASDDFIESTIEERLNQYSNFAAWLTGAIFTKHTN